MTRPPVIFSLLVLTAATVPLSAEPVALGQCVNAGMAVSVSGKLTEQIFAGRPNFESIKDGDEEVHVWILELDNRQCLIDGEFSDPSVSFDRAHIYSSVQGLRKILTAAEGRHVQVAGTGFASHTMHHRAPLVIDVTTLTVK